MLHGAVDHDGDGFRSLAERHSWPAHGWSPVVNSQSLSSAQACQLVASCKRGSELCMIPRSPEATKPPEELKSSVRHGGLAIFVSSAFLFVALPHARLARSNEVEDGGCFGSGSFERGDCREEEEESEDHRRRHPNGARAPAAADRILASCRAGIR